MGMLLLIGVVGSGAAFCLGYFLGRNSTESEAWEEYRELATKYAALRGEHEGLREEVLSEFGFPTEQGKSNG